MDGFNQFIIDGNLVRDVELRQTARGTPTCTYVVAVGRVRFDGEQRIEETDFIPVTTYGRQAEADARFLRKGAGVTVIGQISSWYQREQKKGGFNFEADRVIYRGRSVGAEAPRSEAWGPDDEWLREFQGHGAPGLKSAAGTNPDTRQPSWARSQVPTPDTTPSEASRSSMTGSST